MIVLSNESNSVEIVRSFDSNHVFGMYVELDMMNLIDKSNSVKVVISLHSNEIFELNINYINESQACKTIDPITNVT